MSMRSIRVMVVLCMAVTSACVGAVRLGDKVGPLKLTTLDGPSYVMDNYATDEKVGTVLFAHSTAAEPGRNLWHSNPAPANIHIHASYRPQTARFT